MELMMIVFTDGFEFGACFNRGNGWRCELCDTEKEAYNKLATLISVSGQIKLSNNANEKLISVGKQIGFLTDEDKTAARVAFIDEMERCRY